MNEEEKYLAEAKKKPKWGKAAKVSLGVVGGLSLLMGYISATGMQETEQESDARKPIDDFFASFNARDAKAAGNTLHFPHVQIAESEVKIWSEQDEFNIDFDLLIREGWAFSTLDSCMVRLASADKLHFDVQFSMHGVDAKRYTTCQSLWIVTKKDGRWGIQCRSSFAPRGA